MYQQTQNKTGFVGADLIVCFHLSVFILLSQPDKTQINAKPFNLAKTLSVSHVKHVGA